MTTIQTEAAFEVFKKQFPLIRVVADDDGLRYVLRAGTRPAFYEDLANRVIIANALPLEANLLTWSSARRGIFETTLEIKMVEEAEFTPCY